MKSSEKLKMAITVALAALLLLIIVIYAVVSNKKDNPDSNISVQLISGDEADCFYHLCRSQEQ